MSLQHSIIRRLLAAAPMSLADLQSATQVSLPTLRRAVQELTDTHWIRVVGQAEANGGRPAMLFGIDDTFYTVIGVHLQLPGVRLILADLSGQVLDEVSMFDDTVPAPDACVQAVVGYAARIGTLFPTRQVLGVGIAAPGFIDLTNGDILSIGRVPFWGSFPICRRLQALLGLPVHIANDVDCMAFAELHDTHAPREANLAFVGFDEGVKVSLFVKGELYKGTLGNAGLISGQLLHVPGLSNPEDVTRLLTINGTEQLLAERLAELEPPAQAQYAAMETASPRERVQWMLAHADAPPFQKLVSEQIKVLAVTIANMTLLVQPDIVVFGGLLSALPDERAAELESAIRGYLPGLISNNTILRQGKRGVQGSGALGATHHFLHSSLSLANGDLI